MSARGVLIKPWLFREASAGYIDLSGEDRVAIYRRYVALALEHWGGDEFGRQRAREFLRWHVGFWCRYARQRADGSWPTMQVRETEPVLLSPLEVLLARSDEPALDYVTDCLLQERSIEVEAAPAATVPVAPADVEAEG
jgi:tRNA-dihydrouridine synthase